MIMPISLGWHLARTESENEEKEDQEIERKRRREKQMGEEKIMKVIERMRENVQQGRM